MALNQKRYDDYRLKDLGKTKREMRVNTEIHKQQSDPELREFLYKKICIEGDFGEQTEKKIENKEEDILTILIRNNNHTKYSEYIEQIDKHLKQNSEQKQEKGDQEEKKQKYKVELKSKEKTMCKLVSIIEIYKQKYNKSVKTDFKIYNEKCAETFKKTAHMDVILS